MKIQVTYLKDKMHMRNLGNKIVLRVSVETVNLQPAEVIRRDTTGVGYEYRSGNNALTSLPSVQETEEL